MNTFSRRFLSLLALGTILCNIIPFATFANSSLFGYHSGYPAGIVTDTNGNVYAVGTYSYSLTKITPDGTASSFGTIQPYSSAITIDVSGNIYVANSQYSNVTKITPDGTSTTFGTTGGNPEGITVDGSGNIYTANDSSQNVTKITPDGTTTTFGTTGYAPRGIAVDRSGNVYVANDGNNNVSKITPDGTSTILGNTTGNNPYEMVIDTDGNLYTANIYGNNVTKITPDGTSTTFGTTGSYPYSITIDSSGNIYTANYSSQNVTKVTPDGTSRIIGRTNGNPRSIAIDSSGNIYTADYYNTVSKITPTDTNAPVVTLNGQTYDTGYLNRPYVDPGANWTDDPDGNGQATVSGSVDTNNTGTYLLDYSYTDFAGNTGSGTRTVNVIADTEAPVISPYNGTETTVYLNHTYTEYGASCNDNADGYCVGSMTTTGSVDTTQSGTYTITYTDTDTSGNIGTATRIVTVTPDITAPNIYYLYQGDESTIFTGQNYSYGGYCVDAVDGYINMTTSGSVDTSQSGTYTVTYNCTDLSNNTTTRTATVHVIADTEPPMITLYGETETTLYIGQTYSHANDYSYYCNDNKDGYCYSNVTFSGDVDTSQSGTYVITYSATDNAGNIGTATRTIHVIPDTTPPVITLYGDSEVTMYLNQYYSEAGASCNDNLDGNCNGILTASGNVDTSQLGDYIVTYSAMDNAGNIASATRNVHVIADTEPPVFTLYGDNPQEIAQYADYSDLYGDCTDNADGEFGPSESGGSEGYDDGTIDTSLLGTSTLTYTCTDSAGNTSSGSRVVHVVPDTEPPVITLYGNQNITIPLDSTYNEQGVSCFDNADGNCSGNESISGSVDTSNTGTYIVTYSYTDRSGNIGTATRNVNVGPDSTPPIITIIGDNPLTIIEDPSCCTNTYHDSGATAIDDDPTYVGPIDMTNNVNIRNPGNYTVTYTTTDPSGNTATATRHVNVISGRPPIDLAATKTLIHTGTIIAGDTFAYRFNIKNVGSSTFSGTVEGIDVAPDILDYPDQSSSDLYAPISTSNPNINCANYGSPSLLGNTFSNYTHEKLILCIGTVSIAPGESISYDLRVHTDTTPPVGMTNRVVILDLNEDDIDTPSILTAVQNGTDLYSLQNNNISLSVYDPIPPVVTLSGGSLIHVPQGALYEELGATWTDNMDGSGVISTASSGSVNTLVAGTYSLMYSYTDKGGNTISVDRTVIVDPGNPASVEIHTGGRASIGGGGSTGGGTTGITPSISLSTGIAGAINIQNLLPPPKSITTPVIDPKNPKTPIKNRKPLIPNLDLLLHPQKNTQPEIKGPITDEICSNVVKLHPLSELKATDISYDEFRSPIQKLMMYRGEKSGTGGTLSNFPENQDGIELNTGTFRGGEKITRGEYITLLVRALACHVPEDLWNKDEVVNTGSLMTPVNTPIIRPSLDFRDTPLSILSGSTTVLPEIEIEKDQTGTFSDIPSGSTLEKYIQYAVDQKWINGYESGKFRPDAPISRAEASKILANAIHLNPSDSIDTLSQKFPDVPETNEFNGFIYALVAKGVFHGNSDGQFGPDASISRQEVAKVFANTFLSSIQ